MFDLTKFSNDLLKELYRSELNLKKCSLSDIQLLEDISKEVERRKLNDKWRQKT